MQHRKFVLSQWTVNLSVRRLSALLVLAALASMLSGCDDDGKEIPVTTHHHHTRPPAPHISVLAGNARNTVSWASVSTATSYKLYWATAAGVSTGSTAVPDVTSPYVHAGLTNGTAYYYRLSAANAYGESDLSNEVSATPAPPQIAFVTIPPYGDLVGLVQGRTVNADQPNQLVANYIRVPGGGYWTKPTFAQPTVPLAADGTWECHTVTGGADQLATQFAAFLIPATYSPPACSGQATLPAELYANALAYVFADRPAPVTKITFCQRTWDVKWAPIPVGPGPNYFSDSTDSVWVDATGSLHLKCRWDGEHWQCAEVICEDSLGLGEYQFQVSGVDGFDPNVVLGIFLWDDDVAENHRETDIEMAQWGDASGPNLQYVVQPWDTAGNRYQFTLPTNQELWHAFAWTAAGVTFKTTQPDGTVLQTWDYAGGDTPSHGNEHPRINLWIYNNTPPASDVEVVIKGFAWSSL